MRYLRLLAHALRGIETRGLPRLPGKAYRAADGRLCVPLLPTGVLYDRLALFPFKVTARMREGVRQENLNDYLAPQYRTAGPRLAKTVAVLGAGNVSAIPLTDAFTKLFQEGGVVLLKMSPVNDYLGPVFERVLKPLVDEGCLRIIYGGSDVGAAAVRHRLVDEVHITGSVHSHDALVWGPPGAERDQRKSANLPVLEKPISSELGNVSPWIFLPGEYSRRQLTFQAENIAASVVNNVSFNCVATKVLITLCAAVTHPAGFRSRPSHERLLQTCLGELQYGAVAVNHWPGLMYAMMSPPWGGFPGSSLADAQSGIGAVHNTFMLEGIEKTVLEGPLTMFPKPPWFPSHSHAERVAWSYFQLYHRPSWTNAVKLLFASFQG